MLAPRGSRPLAMKLPGRYFALAVIAFTAPLLFGCSSSTPKATEGAACTEPENPYEEGTGHYAGYEWAAENGGDCNGNSESFNEGCEEYERQEEEYEACQEKER